MERTEQELRDRFHQLYKVTDDGCWRWLGSIQGPGTYGHYLPYGWFSISKKMAHRASWLLNVGPIEPGMSIGHTCIHPDCVNPEHLIKESQTEILRRAHDVGGYRRVRFRTGGPCKGRKLSQAQVDEIRKIYAEGKTKQRTLARRFGVTTSSIHSIVTNKTWKPMNRMTAPVPVT